MISPLDMPAANGRVVTQGHADYCKANGHATHTVDGVVSPHCPRCGDNLPNEKGFVTSAAGINMHAERSVTGGVRARFNETSAWQGVTTDGVIKSFRPACPRCGRDRMGRKRNPLSAKDNRTEVCRDCAYDEALLGVSEAEVDVWPGYPGLLTR